MVMMISSKSATWCLNVHRNHKDYYGRGEGGRGVGRGGTEGGRRGRWYIYCYIVTTRMTPALRWAVMRAILKFHQSWGIKSQEHRFWRERRAEADLNRSPSAYQPNALPLGQTGLQMISACVCLGGRMVVVVVVVVGGGGYWGGW